MVRTLFDTSVLISAFLANHPKHQSCTPWLHQVKTGQVQGTIATHTLAETYAVLTRIPISPRISPALAQQLIRENLKEFAVIPLLAEDYQRVIEQLVTLNLTGGAIYDALIAQAAIKASINRLLTLNPDHFSRLGNEIAQLILVPN